MKKLDSICSKLMHQNAAGGHSGIDNQSVIYQRDQESIAVHDQQDTVDQLDASYGRNSRINKRKNFTPKVFRLCDEEESCQKGKESVEFECSSPLSNEDEDEYRKRRRLSVTYPERQTDSVDGASSDNSSDQAKTETNARNGRSGLDEEEGGVQTPGLLAIVEPDEDTGTPSGRSSSNRSISVLASIEITSASASPSLLGTVPSFIAQHQSPITPTLATPSSNRYMQQRIADPDSKHATSHQGIGVSATGSKTDQSTPVVAYIVRFMGNDCGADQCRFSMSREHFHCKLCNNKLFTKKEEMLRHYKWHRKREESLAYGFMRYSASDDCSHHFTDCVHNLRQTHYHCLQEGCDKLYISTSDVQMHANSHRKQAHIAKEGFQRVKGSEQCTYAGCPFTDPSNRTTHFHCLRPGCTHSFKNKADMDKHKAHHTRDEQLTRDGFKKYMKSEACSFGGCAFSRIVNHIHCIRPGCDYVLHSTSQMYSHKRKHEKQDKRVSDYVAQQQAIATAFKNAAALMTAAGASGGFSSSSTAPSPTLPNSSTVGHQLQSDTGPSNFPNIRAIAVNGSADSSLSAAERNDRSFSPPVPKKVAAAVPGRLKLKQYDPHAKTFHDAGILGGNARRDSNPAAAAKSQVPSTIQKTELFDPDDVAAMGIDMSTLQSPIQFMKSVTKAEPDGETENEADTCPPQTTAPLTVETAFSHAKQQQQNVNGRSKGDDSWKKFITRYTANDPCVPLCPLLYKDHYHCTAGEGCKMTFKSKDGVRDHAKQHEQLCLAIDHFRTIEADEDCKIEGCPHAGQELHYHCVWDNCSETIGSSEPVFRRLEHHKVHEYSNQLISDSRAHSLSGGSGPAAVSRNSMDSAAASTSPSQSSILTASGEIFKRKRGRPPKYNVLDVNVNPSTHVGQSPEILVTSFKLAKGASGPAPTAVAGRGQSPQQGQNEQQASPSSQSRRGRPRTVSSPRHAAEEATFSANQTAAAAVELLRQQQAQQLQQQMELLRMWNSNLDSILSPVTSSATATEQRNEASKRPQFDGFTTYMASENCPDSLCRYRSLLHYHCRLPRCFYSSNRGDQLESHHRDFHDAFEIPDGYACYDRSYNCRHVSCQYNGQARHFHCQKAGCSAALLKINELATHTSKGHEPLSHEQQFGSPTQASSSPDADPLSNALRHAKSGQSQVVRTSGIFYPSSMENQNSPSRAGRAIPPGPFSSQSSASTMALNPATFAALAQSLSPAFALFNAAAALGVGAGNAVPNSGGVGANGMVGMTGNALPYTVEQQCGRPFCKLKRRLHYHCTLCHQGFSHFDRLQVHMQKHGVVLPPVLAQPPPIPPSAPPQAKTNPTTSIHGQQAFASTSNTGVKRNEDKKTDHAAPQPTSDDNSVVSRSTSQPATNQKKVKFHMFQPTIMKFSSSADREGEGGASVTVPSNGASSGICLEPTLPVANTKLSPPKRSKKTSNQGLPVKDNVAGQNANASGNSMHFKFVDCTADVAHAAGNRNAASPPQTLPSASSIQKLLQQDTPVFSTSVSPPVTTSESTSKRPVACTDLHCPKHAGANLHYHCEKCEFWTPESTKWHMHVKQHARMDQVAALGFRKVLAGEGNGSVQSAVGCPLAIDCSVANQSHYHCITCNSTALSQSQMSAHKATKHPSLEK